MSAVTTHPAWKPLPVNVRKDCHRYQVLALLRQHGTLNGTRARELMPHMTVAQLATHLHRLHLAGHCWHVAINRKRALYFSTPELHDAYLSGNCKTLAYGLRGDVSASMTLPLRHVAMRLDAAAPAIVPPDVKITRGRSWTHDPRFQLPPDLTRLPPDMEGAGFVAQWNRLRRGRSTPKKAAP